MKDPAIILTTLTKTYHHHPQNSHFFLFCLFLIDFCQKKLMFCKMSQVETYC